MSWLMLYILIGVWTYICVCTARLEMFKRAYDWYSILKGALLGIILWPLVPMLLCFLTIQEDRMK